MPCARTTHTDVRFEIDGARASAFLVASLLPLAGTASREDRRGEWLVGILLSAEVSNGRASRVLNHG